MSVELDALCDSGFCRVPGLLPRYDVEAVLASIHRTIAAQLRHLDQPDDDGTLHQALRRLHAADLDRYRKTLGALWRKADVSGLMRHPALFTFLRDALGWEDVFLPGGEVMLLMAADLKIPGGYFGLGPHQDFPSVQGSLDGLVAWIPLTKVDRDGWTMEVLPGSHRKGLITDVEVTRNGWEVRSSQLQEAAWHQIEADIGDVVFMSVFTVHRSALTGDPRRLRIALSTRFDNAAEPTFVARTYPTAYQRTVHREQYEPDFPDPAQVAALFRPAI